MERLRDRLGCRVQMDVAVDCGALHHNTTVRPSAVAHTRNGGHGWSTSDLSHNELSFLFYLFPTSVLLDIFEPFFLFPTLLFSSNYNTKCNPGT